METLDSGLKFRDTEIGQGEDAKIGDTVVVHYRGWLDSGQTFDTSRQPGRDPFSFTIGAGRVIRGWDEGVVGMKPGGTRELEIPAALGYGARAIGPIPPNSTLHFEIELLEVR